jgi:hypothetical protein
MRPDFDAIRKRATSDVAEGTTWELYVKKSDTDTIELLDYITDLEKQLEAERWIPMSERLPIPGERVIAYWDTMTGEAYMNKGKRWIRDHTDIVQWFGDSPVTHWRPLPEPPKEE